MSDFTKSRISGHDNWSTPQKIIDDFDEIFHFSKNPDGSRFDPCPLYGNAESVDGLSIEWPKSTFMNPPYSRGQMKLWCEKAYRESLKGKTVVGLLRGDTSTQWFHEWVLGKAELRFVKGRVKFGESKNSPPFPSIIAIWRPHLKEVKE